MRFRLGAIAAVLTAALAVAGCGGSANTTSAAPAIQQQPTQPSAALPSQQEIAGLFDQWDQALATLDPGKVAARYAPDAVLLPTVSNKVRTDHAGIVDYFAHFLQSKPQGKILDEHIKILDPTAAIDTGTYEFTLTNNGQKNTVDARYTFVYEKVGDQWLIINHHSSVMPETAEVRH
jgi:uncharacterized protein (TIGR02246 family)